MYLVQPALIVEGVQGLLLVKQVSHGGAAAPGADLALVTLVNIEQPQRGSHVTCIIHVSPCQLPTLPSASPAATLPTLPTLLVPGACRPCIWGPRLSVLPYTSTSRMSAWQH